LVVAGLLGAAGVAEDVLGDVLDDDSEEEPEVDDDPASDADFEDRESVR